MDTACVKEAAIYLHIPFCVRKCAYCDFLSAPAGDDARRRYAAALARQIRLVGESLSQRRGFDGGKLRVPSVFLGGGTPSLLSPSEAEQVFGALREAFAIAPDAEISMEMNPGTVTAEKLRAYRALGVSRVSLGLQSADNGLLAAIGRIHTFEDFARTYDAVREAGFTNVSVDVMSSLPGQTLAMHERTLAEVIRRAPEHISSYSLILEEGTPLYEKRDQLTFPDEETEVAFDALTHEMLAAAGYRRYEVSNYAKPGYACRHNLRYWQGGDYLGFGIGAAGLFETVRYRAVTDRETYCAELEKTAPDLKTLIDERLPLSLNDRMEERMFLGLRCTEGISKARFAADFGTDYDRIYGKITGQLADEGLLAVSGDNVRLTDFGMEISNRVLAEFLLE